MSFAKDPTLTTLLVAPYLAISQKLAVAIDHLAMLKGLQSISISITCEHVQSFR